MSSSRYDSLPHVTVMACLRCKLQARLPAWRTWELVCSEARQHLQAYEGGSAHSAVVCSSHGVPLP